MKKLLSLVIVLTLVLSMGVGVFAEPGPYDDPITEVTINKDVKLTNEGTTNPAETFSFTVGKGKVLESAAGITDAPDFPEGSKEFSIAFIEGQTEGSANITLPKFEGVGVYEYDVQETVGNTAGMAYDNTTYKLRVTVVNNDAKNGFDYYLTLLNENEEGQNVKTDAFQNTFSAGDLVITKQITGNYAVFTDEFEVTVKLTPPEGKVIKKGPITVDGASSGVGTVSDPDSNGTVTVTFKVTNNSEVKISNIPYGVSYVVTEDAGYYESNVTEDGFTGEINAATQGVELVNTLDTEIETGLNLDNLPYILILATATIGLAGFTMRRRFNNR